MRYNGEKPGKKKERKGFTELSLSRLTRANLSRNRKRTVLTVVAMGVIGILFMVVATVIHCADPKEIAKEEFEGDYEIYVDSWENDKMNPDRSWKNLMQNNPLSDEFISRIRQISGVEEVKVKTMIYGTLTELDPEGEILTPGIQGFDPSYASVIEDGLIEGDVTYEELEKGDKIVIEDMDFGVWYVDAYDHPELYLHKEVEFTAQVLIPRGMGDDMFVPVRKIMTCCANDVRYYGYPCKITDGTKVKKNQWVHVRARFEYEAVMYPDRKQPVLYLEELTEAEKPKDDVVFLG